MDTSALVKLYVREAGSVAVRREASALWLQSAYSGDLAFMAYGRRQAAAAADAGLRVPRG